MREAHINNRVHSPSKLARGAGVTMETGQFMILEILIRTMCLSSRRSEVSSSRQSRVKLTLKVGKVNKEPVRDVDQDRQKRRGAPVVRGSTIHQ